MPNILVVIPTLNEAPHIEEVLHTLSQDLPATASVRFVVADGGSHDGTQDIVQRLATQRSDLTLLHNPKRLQSAAVNLAVREYGDDCDVLVRCDAHAVYPAGYVRRLIDSLEAHQADSVVVPMDSVGDTCLRKAVAWVSDSPIGSGGSAHRGGKQSGFVDHGHHAAFRMASFKRVGGYDDTFSHNEDAELDCRQRAIGAKVFLDSTIRLGYFPRSSLAALWRQYKAYGRGRSRTVRKHPQSLKPRQFAVPFHLVLCLIAVLASPWAPALLAWPVLYLGALAAASLKIAYQQRSACGLLAGAAAFTMHVSWALGFFSGWLQVREKRWSPSRLLDHDQRLSSNADEVVDA